MRKFLSFWNPEKIAFFHFWFLISHSLSSSYDFFETKKQFFLCIYILYKINTQTITFKILFNGFIIGLGIYLRDTHVFN